jgi:hypothetical protein
MPKPLVIVESPAKAKTIAKFLGKDWMVEASIGHVRDLPSNASEIPASIKAVPWARLGVDIEGGYAPCYVVPADKRGTIRELKAKLKDASILYLATDEDREGEAISWHLLELLAPKVPVKRMVFHEITKAAIARRSTNCRDVDSEPRRRQEARASSTASTATRSARMPVAQDRAALLGRAACRACATRCSSSARRSACRSARRAGGTRTSRSPRASSVPAPVGRARRQGPRRRAATSARTASSSPGRKVVVLTERARRSAPGHFERARARPQGRGEGATAPRPRPRSRPRRCNRRRAASSA